MKNEEILKKLIEFNYSLKVVAELFNTMVDQVTELNLLVLDEKNSIYEKLLSQFDESVRKIIEEKDNEN